MIIFQEKFHVIENFHERHNAIREGGKTKKNRGSETMEEDSAIEKQKETPGIHSRERDLRGR